MDRRALTTLLEWKSDPNRKPLVVRGARQVGKTWLLKEFGHRAFDTTVYVNCEREASVRSIFDGDLDPSRILRALSIATRTTITQASTLIVIDEVQDAPRALTALKYFAEEQPDLHIAVAGSLRGVALRSDQSFPVGKVDFLDLQPLDFSEFLRGIGEEHLDAALSSLDWSLIAPFAERLTELLRQYLFIGGMPEAVHRFSVGASLSEVRSIQRSIITGYVQDFAKYANATTSRRIAEVWASIPGQLAKENARFILGNVRQGARAREFDSAIQWLSDAGLIHKVSRFTKPGHPVRSYEDPSIFKLYLLDVGLLGAMADLDASVVVHGTGIFEEFKGALTEQYVLQQILATRTTLPMYWKPASGSAEVDFAIEAHGALIPIEVKAAANLKSKSLQSYVNQFQPEAAWRFSLADYREQSALTNIPLYGIVAFLTGAVTPRGH